MRAEKAKTAPCPRRCRLYATTSAAVPDFGHAQIKKARFRGPFSLRHISSAAMMMMMMMMPMVVPAAAAEANRLQLEAGAPAGDVQSGLALRADRLQRKGMGWAADQEIAAAADADRSVGADAAITAGEIAASEPAVRRIHRPGEFGLLGNAEIEADPAHGCEIGFGTAAVALEHAFEAGDRADDEADILAALALQDAGAYRRQRVGASDRCRERSDGDTECRESHRSCLRMMN